MIFITSAAENADFKHPEVTGNKANDKNFVAGFPVLSGTSSRTCVANPKPRPGERRQRCPRGLLGYAMIKKLQGATARSLRKPKALEI
ncbi:MAG: hypothetical protein U5L74_13805 [Ideonella sp.]|nr:hypothetical protein [Ideonella sp.]